MVEVLLALTIGGLVLTAATSLLITISRAWAERPATRDAFDAHINGVAHFLTAVLEEATLSTMSRSGDQSIDLQRPIGYSESEDPLIHFYLRKGPPLLVWPNGPASRVHCFFEFMEGEGLSKEEVLKLDLRVLGFWIRSQIASIVSILYSVKYDLAQRKEYQTLRRQHLPYAI